MSGGTRFEARRGRRARNIVALHHTLVRTERGDHVTASALLKRPAVRLERLVERGDVCLDLEVSTRELRSRELENEVKYAGYLQPGSRARTAAAPAGRAQDSRRIRLCAACLASRGRSSSAYRRSGLRRSVRPRRIPGMTPAAWPCWARTLGKAIPKPLNSREFQDTLARRARRAAISLGAELAEQLEVYFRLLSNWNTQDQPHGARPRPASHRKHSIGCSLSRWPQRSTCRRSQSRMMDIGSGGGSPAIPLVLALPRMQLVMVESKTRKSVFLREAVRALDLAAEVVRPGSKSSSHVQTSTRRTTW